MSPLLDSRPTDAPTQSPSGDASSAFRVAMVCASRHHGNTQRIAEAMASAVGAVVLTPKQAAADGLQNYDFIGFGSGIYFGMPDGNLRRLIAALPQLPRFAFIFSTSGLPWLWRIYHFGLRRRLRSRGCRVTGDFACSGWDTVGPLAWIGGLNRRHPDTDDCLRAQRFIAAQIELAQALRQPGMERFDHRTLATAARPHVTLVDPHDRRGGAETVNRRIQPRRTPH